MTDVVIVLTTVADDEAAERLARQLIEERLAACVSLYPTMTSFYRWKGKLERAAERQMVIKTTQAGLDALRDRLAQLHGYDVPEFLVVSSEAGAAYLAWVNQEVGKHA